MTDNTPSEAAKGPWECFQDASYYDMWCVRRVHDRTFGQGFHLVNGEEAAALRDYLNTRADRHLPAAEPVGYLYEKPGFQYYSSERFPAGVMANAVKDATETPLYATPPAGLVERAVMVCPQCEGEGGYPDGVDDAACHTECTRCGSNGWIVDLAALCATPPTPANSDAIPEMSLPPELKALSGDDIVYHYATPAVNAELVEAFIEDLRWRERQARTNDIAFDLNAARIYANIAEEAAKLLGAKGDGNA